MSSMAWDSVLVLARSDRVECRDDIFEPYKDEIHRLYVNERIRLNELREMMKLKYGLDQTEKQWKTMLRQWKFKHNLNPSDAAHCLKLLNEATSRGLSQTVIFSGQKVTRSSIRKYIQRSSHIKSEADLLAKINPNETAPTYIRLASATPIVPHQPSPSTSTVSPAVCPGPSHVNLTKGAPTNQIVRSTQGYHLPSEHRFSASHTHLGSLESLIAPFRPSALDGPSTTPPSTGALDRINMALSCHPIALADPVSLSELNEHHGYGFDEHVWGDFSRCPQVNDATQFSSTFVANSLRWCICDSQNNRKYDEHANYHFHTALWYFACMLRDCPQPGEDCISATSIAIAILESVGQSRRLAKLLAECNQVSTQALGSSNPLSRTLGFAETILQLRGSGKPPAYDIKHLKSVHQEILSRYPRSRGPALVAEFNVAWAQLEMKQYEVARKELQGIFAECQSHFGASHMHTIMALASLARATMKLGDIREARRILVSEVRPRIRSNFPENHPYVWELDHRQAFMLMQLAKLTDEHNKSNYLHQAENLLRHVVVNRHHILGSNNPKSVQSFRLLSDVLEQQNRHQEAYQIWEWTRTQLPQSNAGMS
ncbi:hypothetical protein PV10_06823 [Exophiala mesophila]|uniref:Clr5 domain-containing protein n=1 Tax=Exophiala mesophila TaxID=212818 RepID=A0A0D1Z3R7_EXOME|nr:uncharacterized protein PV10_06823 [Exophiala mesophila]KIV89422.1 hypothetical protein PV10_06823 [Exophiala mesophila]